MSDLLYLPFLALNPTIKSVPGIIIMTICFLGGLCCIIMAVLIYCFRYFKPITVSSPVFCYLQLLGILMGYIATLLYLGIPNVGKCISKQLLMTTGFVLVIGSIVAKNYR